MNRLIVGSFAVPAFLSIGASAFLMERTAVVLGAGLACAATVVLACVLVGMALTRRGPLWPVFVGAFVCLALTVSVAWLHWPLRARYHLSRSAIDQLAQDIRAGQQPAGPVRVGTFNVQEVEVNRHGIVCLWVDTDPAGKTGLVQCEPEHLPFNLWSMISLDDRWQFISED